MSHLPSVTASKPRKRWRKWHFVFFISWAIFSTSWMYNSFQTRDVDSALLTSGFNVKVLSTAKSLEFLPSKPKPEGLLFFCGSGVEAEAYAPLLRPIADAENTVIVVRLPARFAFLEGHKTEALANGKELMASAPWVERWTVAGHSLGGALSCRFVQTYRTLASSMVLIGTTHPKEDDLSALKIRVTKVYGSEDGVAPQKKVEANKSLLPAQTRWVLIPGANHSQFGRYGHQIQDGQATITRLEQERMTRDCLMDAITGR